MTDTNMIQRVWLSALIRMTPSSGGAATVAKWAAMGPPGRYLLLTSGDKGSHDRGLHPGQVAAQREQEQREAALELGVQSVTFTSSGRPAGEYLSCAARYAGGYAACTPMRSWLSTLSGAISSS